MRVFGYIKDVGLEQVVGDPASPFVGQIWINSSEVVAKYRQGGVTRILVATDLTQTLTNKTLTGCIAVNLVSGAATVTLPTVTGTLATLAGTEVITNKDIDGGTAANTRRITLPKDTKANLDALTRKEGTVVFATDENKLYIDDGASLVAPPVGSSTLATATKTTTYTLTSSDDLIYADATSASFTLTLPAAASNPGKLFRITATHNDLTKIVTIDGNGAETINGATTYLLNTQYQSVSIVSDGTNWLIVDKKTETPWVAYTPTVSNFGTVSSVTFLWKRVGDSIFINGHFIAGTVVAAAASFTLPTGLTFNTTILGATANSTMVGDCNNLTTGTNPINNIALFYDGSDNNEFFFAINGTSNVYARANGDNIASSTNTVTVRAWIPIANWEA